MGATASVFDSTGHHLVKAAKSGDAEHVIELISARPELLHYATYRQMTPTHFAARLDHVDLLQQLLSKAEEVEHCMHLYQQQGRHRPSQTLVHQLVNTANDRGVTPLMLAVDKGCLASIKLLLQKGANPWAVDNLGGRTALHYAALRNNVGAVQELLGAVGEMEGPVRFPNRRGTRFIDMRTQTGFTALHYAVHASAQQALAVLLNDGANPLLHSLFDSLECINCPRGSTPLHVAARAGNAEAARQLLKAYVEKWEHRHVLDLRLVADGENCLPCELTPQSQRESLSSMLLPSVPLASLFDDVQLSVISPASLSAIAGAVLRSSMMQELQAIEGQGQTQQEHELADAETGLVAVVGVKAGNGDSQEDEQRGSVPAGYKAACSHAGGCCCNSHQLGSCGDCKQQQLQQPGAAVCAGNAPAEHLKQQFSSAVNGCSSDSDELCGVCFDSHPTVALAPCNHQLCVSCCRSMLALRSRCVLVCPFCRGPVGHLTAAAVGV